MSAGNIIKHCYIILVIIKLVNLKIFTLFKTVLNAFMHCNL